MSSAHKPKLPINIVPAQVAPGAIIDDRYCVISPFVASSQAWVIDATDLSRVFGRAPNHRVGLHKVTSDHAQEHRLRVAVRCDREVQPKFRELRHLFDGLLVVADHVEGEKLPPVLRAGDAYAVAEAASHVLARLHGAGIRGIRFSRDQFILNEGKAYLRSYAHLDTPGSLRSDLDAFHEFLATLSTAIHGRLTPKPHTAMEYSQRFATTSEIFTWSDILPPIAPYVTPHSVVETVFDRFIEARQGHTREVRVTAPRGYGKTRLLHELAAEFTHQGEAIVVLAEAPERGGAASNVVQRIFNQLTDYCASLPTHVANGLRSQVVREISGFEGVIATALPRFAVWLGIELGTTAPKIDIGESFARQANVLATVLRTICSQRRPLVLLVDNGEAMDVASAALLEELRRRDEGHILIVVAFLNSLQLETQPHSQHRLPSFGEVQVREFVERSLPGEIDDPAAMAAHLYTTTAGRPLNCWAVLQDWVSDGTISKRARGWTLTRDLGTDVIEAERLFEARVSNLSEDAFRLVLCYALSDTPLTREHLAAVLDWSDARVAAAVRDGIRNAVVQSIEGHLSFNHGTVSDLLIARAEPDTKVALHHRLADWIERFRTGDVVALAFHREHASGEGKIEELARLHLMAARKCLDVFDAGRAKWFAQRGLERTLSPTIEASLTRALADGLLLAGQVDQAVETYKQAIDLAPDRSSAIRLASDCVYALVCRDGNRSALAVANYALKKVRMSLNVPSFFLLARGLYASLALLLRVRSKRPVAERRALSRLYVSLFPTLLLSPGRLLLTIAENVYISQGEENSRGASGAWATWAYLQASLGLTERAQRNFSRAYKIATRCQDLWSQGVVYHMRGHIIEAPSGDIEGGLASLQKASELFDRSGDNSISSLSKMFSAFYCKDLGDDESARRYAQRAIDLCENSRAALGYFPARALRAEVESRKEQFDATELTNLALELEATDAVIAPDEVVAYAAIARAWFHVGDCDAAMRAARSGIAKIDGPPNDAIYEVFTSAVLALAGLTPTRAHRRVLRTASRKAKKYVDRFPRLRPVQLLSEALLQGRLNEGEQAAIAAEALGLVGLATDIREAIRRAESVRAATAQKQ